MPLVDVPIWLVLSKYLLTLMPLVDVPIWLVLSKYLLTLMPLVDVPIWLVLMVGYFPDPVTVVILATPG